MNISRRIYEYYGKYRLTVSGDISIASVNPAVLYELVGEQRRDVEKMIDTLQKQYPFLKVKIKNGINEAEINFFAFGSALSDEAFLDHLQEWLIQTASILTSDPKTVVTINFNGIFFRNRLEEHFRFLNKGMEIQYRITEKKNRTWYDYVSRSSYTRILGTVLLIAALVWFIYNNIAVQPPQAGKLV
ncbi:hypothetical protein NXG27_00410 [Megasphaera paucivorans]|uniref:Uncharacterized protein n=1 Tax=Megasphaera paucivorans TaxID=349095 RepID=A0A1G9Q3X7_9FIRM|nr:hypothetical protein [Megasphaera paucivorans]SDM05035.1 hypothetical protein SAMN05660299_00083 [Megasphaera paucivorans]